MRSLTYVSRPTRAFPPDEFVRLGVDAARFNALDGITGLLVFNGGRFCQTVEGSAEALDHLLGRLRRDRRHDEIKIVADEPLSERRFRSWDMQLLAVPADRAKALAVARERFADQADVAARAKIYETVGGIFA